MTTGREQVLAAVFQRLETISGPKVLRETAIPNRVPDDGLIIMRDGDPGEPEITLGPPRYWYLHAVQLELYWAGDDRDQGVDGLAERVAAALERDRTLGGLAEWLQMEADEPETVPVEGGIPVKSAVATAVIHYQLDGPFGSLA